jgi:hypothetical protein
LGGKGVDTLNGGDDNDRLDGGSENDILNGGNGNDTFVINSSSGTDTINGGDGGDKVESSVSFSLNGTTSVENLTLTGSGNINGTGNSSANNIFGNDATNTLNGGDGDDVLNGEGGNDTVNGEGGNDRLFEGAGNDALNGGAGSDQLSGGADRDRYNGGADSDILAYDAADFGSGATAGQYDGGTGTDTIQMSLSGSTTLDLRAVDDSFIRNVEAINLQTNHTLSNGITITNNDRVFLGFNDVNAMNDQHVLRIDGGTGDQVTITDFGWQESAQQQTIGNQVYDVYTNGQATLLVDADIQVDGSFV